MSAGLVQDVRRTVCLLRRHDVPGRYNDSTLRRLSLTLEDGLLLAEVPEILREHFRGYYIDATTAEIVRRLDCWAKLAGTSPPRTEGRC